MKAQHHVRRKGNPQNMSQSRDTAHERRGEGNGQDAHATFKEAFRGRAKFCNLHF